MSYLFDSDVCIDLLRGRDPSLAGKFRAIPLLECMTSAVVEAELRVGVEKSKTPARAREYLDSFLGRFTVLPVDREVARKYAEIRVAQESRGVRIGSNDLFIAASALRYGLVLVTRNFREFSRIEGLKIESIG